MQMHRAEFSPLLRIILIIVFIVVCFAFFYFTDYSRYLTTEKISATIETIRQFITSYGSLGTILYLVAGSFAILINTPTILIIAISTVIFGKLTGILISVIIVYTGISLVYFIAHFLGRPFAKSLFRKKFMYLEKRFEEKGFMTVVYLRLLFFMAPALNWMLGVSNISYKDFLFGSILGTFHNIILFAWLSSLIINRIEEGGSLNPIKTPKLLLPLCIGALILLTIRIIDYRRGIK